MDNPDFKKLCERASIIGKLVKEGWDFDDAADIALYELQQDPHRTDREVAVHVAHLIGQP